MLGIRQCLLLSRVWLCDSMDYSPSGSSVHGIPQARIVEWVAIPFSRGSSWPRGLTSVSCTAGRFFTVWATREELRPTQIIQDDFLIMRSLITSSKSLLPWKVTHSWVLGIRIWMFLGTIILWAVSPLSSQSGPLCRSFLFLLSLSVHVRAKLLQLCPTFFDPMGRSLPGSYVQEILQARILEWVVISFSRGSSWPRDQTHTSCIGRWVLYQQSHLKNPGTKLKRGMGRSPGGGNGSPLQYSWLGNPVSRGAWWAKGHGVAWLGHGWITFTQRHPCDQGDTNEMHLFWSWIYSESPKETEVLRVVFILTWLGSWQLEEHRWKVWLVSGEWLAMLGPCFGIMSVASRS